MTGYTDLQALAAEGFSTRIIIARVRLFHGLPAGATDHEIFSYCFHAYYGRVEDEEKIIEEIRTCHETKKVPFWVARWLLVDVAHKRKHVLHVTKHEAA